MLETPIIGTQCALQGPAKPPNEHIGDCLNRREEIDPATGGTIYQCHTKQLEAQKGTITFNGVCPSGKTVLPVPQT